MKLQTLEGNIDLSVLPASVNKPRTDAVVVVLTLLCVHALPLVKSDQCSCREWMVLVWSSRDWDLGDFCASLAVMPLGQMSGKYIDCHYLLDLVSGPCFYFLCMYNDTLKNWNQISCPHCVPEATRHAEIPFSIPFWFSLPFLAPKPAALLNFTCSIQWEKALLELFMGNHHRSYNLSGIIKKNENVSRSKMDKSV